MVGMTSRRTSYRLALAVTLGTSAFLVLASGAVGIIGDGRADRAYAAVLAVLVVGAVVARLRAAGMAVVLLLAAMAQVLVPVVLVGGRAPGTDTASLLDVTGLTLMFCGLFIVAAALFRRAASARTRVAAPGT
jgi:lysylphosphatidylglycerol synthetase-like protein (DUF2156 family)